MCCLIWAINTVITRQIYIHVYILYVYVGLGTITEVQKQTTGTAMCYHFSRSQSPLEHMFDSLGTV